MKKWVIFGASRTGRMLFDEMNGEDVLCFADNHLAGTEFCGKEVVSFARLKELADSVNVVIGSVLREDEIAKQLEENGIPNYFSYNCVYYDKMIDAYKLSSFQNIALVGINKGTDLLLEKLGEHGCLDKVKCFVSDEVDEYKGIPCREWGGIEGEIDCLLINSRRCETPIRDELFGRTPPYFVADFYDFDGVCPKYANPGLARFKDLHKGKRCFIIGNGPSLRMDDLDKLERNGEITFACNRIYLAFDKTKWRPTYYCVEDVGLIMADFDKIRELEIEDKFACDYYNYWNFPKVDNIHCIHKKLEFYQPNLPGFSSDVSKYVDCGYTVTYSVGMQLAAYMGFAEIYLLGVDAANTSEHFTKDYLTPREKEQEKERVMPSHFCFMERLHYLAYKKAEAYSRKNGFRIYNATRGGKLEVFERVDFASLF